jgi:Ca2+-binding RTX toxin-like protein
MWVQFKPLILMVYDINAIASDGSLSDSKAVAITVTNINEAPIVSNAIASQSVDTNATFNFALPNNIFTDPEGDNLNYNANTPAWLNFNSTTKIFTGTAPNTVGTNAVTVQVNDGNGNTTSTNFNIFVKAATVVGNVSNGTNTTFDYSSNTVGISIVTGDIAETIKGGLGADKIQGAGGNDIIFGNAGKDRLYGEAGDDILYGGLGTDNLWGGLGSDTFVLQAGQGLDIANDFLQGTDKLGLSGGLTFGIGNVTSAPFGTATKVFAPDGVELMRLLNFAGTLTASDFTTVV